MSPLEAAATAIDIHNTAAAWNKALLDNSARPSGALVYSGGEGRMTAEQFARLRDELEAGFQQPILKLSLHVPIDSRDALFRNLEQFAKQNSFSFDLTWVQQENDTMSARMKRQDGTLFVVSNGFDREEFFLRLLPSLEDARSVADVRPPADAPQLVSKIRTALASVPSLSISKDSADATLAR